MSYSITEIHQDHIVDPVLAANNVEKLEILGLLTSRDVRDLESEELTDATDDFDFVTADDHDHELVFRALDRNQRTDTWFSNVEEEDEKTKIWDPDSDDDGLTDGQETYWVTSADRSNPYEEIRADDVNQQGFLDFEKRLGTDPNDKDSDGDGYWDGWIGVADVDRRDDVVLYMEHLQTGNGIEGDEIVQEQAGTHTWQDDEHSNVHIGELQWGTDPSARADVPAPSLSIEVDYYHGANYEPLADSSWGDGIESNYALYDVDVTVIEDEVLEEEDFLPCIPVLFDPGCVDPENGFGYREIAATALYHKSTGADEYVLIANKAGGAIPNKETQSGVNLVGRPYQALFTKGMEDDVADVSSSAIGNSPYSDGLAMVAAKTQIHEIGHSFAIGEADDKSLLEDPVRKFTRDGEVYSGTSADDTPEELNGFDEWSIMRSGWSAQLHNPPMEGRYFVFSVEEISTLGEPR